MELTPLKVKWLTCIELLYITVCSYFPQDILNSMKWYVGKSMIYDLETMQLRDKSFYMDWGFGCYYMFMEFVSRQSLMDNQYHQPYIKDTSHALNTK